MNKPESWEDELKTIKFIIMHDKMWLDYKETTILIHSLLKQQRENCAKEYYLTVQNDSTIIQTEENILNAPTPTTEKK